MQEQHSPYAIELQDVSKVYKIYAHPSDRLKQSFTRGRRHYFTEHTALKPLSLKIPRGHTVGVIGMNGSGKSTLLQLITGTLSPSSGSINVYGRVSALLELGAGFNPAFSGNENIALSGSIMGMSKEQMAARYEQIVAFAGLPRHMLDQPVSSYSSGMYVRLAFAVAIAVEPDILIVDEALAVGDEGFQRKCFARIQQLQQDGATILFVSHSARTVTDLCDHAVLLDAGELLTEGSPASVVGAYHHMLFAREEERPAIRAQIKGEPLIALPPAMPEKEAEPVQVEQVTIERPESFISYPKDGGEISQVRLFDAKGNAVQTLYEGQEYRLCYQFRAERKLSQLRLSMMFKTMTGVELAGALAYGKENQLRQVSVGETLQVAFRFTCKLTCGDYFVNVGAVVEEFGQFTFVHRMVDVLHIKVEKSLSASAREVQPRGFVDIGAHCTIVHHSE